MTLDHIAKKSYEPPALQVVGVADTLGKEFPGIESSVTTGPS